MEGMTHDDHRERRDALLTSDDILMSVAMSRLCMQSYRVVQAVRERQKGVAPVVGEGAGRYSSLTRIPRTIRMTMGMV